MLKALTCCVAAVLAAIPTKGFGSPKEIPKRVQSCIASAGLGYQLDTRITPSFLSGDFYGDRKRAQAVRVLKNGKRGIVICEPDRRLIQRLGAGRPFNGMADLNFSSWKVYPLGKVDQGVGEGPPPVLLGDALWIEWEESASAIVYWNGHEFVWYQQGD